MALSIYTIILENFRSPFTMLGLRVGGDHIVHGSPRIAQVMIIISSNDAKETGLEQNYKITGTQKMRQL